MLLRPALFCVALAAVMAAAPAWAEDAPPAKSEHKLTNAKSYVEIDPIYTTIVSDNHAVGMLMVGIGVDIPDDKLRAMVNPNFMPVLRDAYVRSLMGFSAVNVRPDAQPDVAALATRLQTVTDRALGHKGARVLLAQVALRVTK